jgi:hypothetical protein
VQIKNDIPVRNKGLNKCKPAKAHDTHTKKHTLKSGVNWQRLLKQKYVTHTGIKLGLGVFRKITCFEGLSQHITVEVRLSRLIGMVSHTDIQKIQIIGFFFENRPHWQFEVGNNLYKQLF